MPDEASENDTGETDETQGTPDTMLHNTFITVGAGEEEDTDEDDSVKPLPDRLISESRPIARWRCRMLSPTIPASR